MVDPRGSHLETESLKFNFIKGLSNFLSHRHQTLSLTLSTLHSHSPSPLSLSLHSQRLVLSIPHSYSMRSSPSLKPTLGNPFLKCLFCFKGLNFFFLVFVLVGSQKVDLGLSRIWVFLYFFMTLIIC